jgi:hypothetical protein
MKKPKTYEVVVSTTAQWFGTVEAHSRAAAKRLGEDQFNEGDFRQIEEDIVKIKVSEVRS